MLLNEVARTGLRIGFRRCFALAVGVVPFGIVYGVAVAQSSVNPFVGYMAGPLVFAGASQITLLELYESDAAWYVAVGTSLIINARLILYSAALAPSFQDFPRRWRLGLGYMMTDQATSLSLVEFRNQHDPVARRWFYLGAAATLWTFWQAGTLVGVLAGTGLPDSLQFEFMIPLMFTALVVPALRNRPAILAAVVSALVTVGTGFMPPGTNILAGAFAGIATGSALTWWMASSGTGDTGSEDTGVEES